MAEQPRGTVTMLFTDIEGSTRLLERLGTERYGQALELHRRLLRDAFERHGGYEVDYEGDAFFVAFADAGDALAAAAEAQHALGGASWPEGGEIRVRVGVHTGEPLAVPPKYLGLDVHKAARIMAAGHGGQVLVSEATRRAVPDVELSPLGEHRLKDLVQPEPLYQLRLDGLPSEFPALRTLGNRPNNLPVQANPLVGRETEVDQIVSLLRNDASRIVTLTGTGGIGKTRLALQVAAELLDDYPSGAFFVSLAPITDRRLVVPAIAQALAVRPEAGEELERTLVSYLEDKQLLLLLDNFEQVVDAASGVADLLASCPQVRLLVTSRERLRLASERVHAVPPLQVPEDERNFAALAESEAVALFVTRALAATGRFALTEANAAAVAGVCRRLDGLPLAIELAAARTNVLPPQALLERLEQRLPLLTVAARDADERHQTLRQTIEWSYDLLSPEEQRLFARLAVFVDGCRIEAAEAVCDADGDLGSGVLEGVSSLVEKNLVQQRADPDGQPRFWMFETIREFALERLAEACELDSLRRTHAQAFLSLVRDVMRGHLTITEELMLLARENANIHAALAWAKEDGGVADFAGAVVDLCRLWLHRGQLQEGLRWAEAALSRSETLDDETLVGLLAMTSELFRFAGDHRRAKSLKLEALEADRQSANRVRSKHGDLAAVHVLADLADMAIAEGEIDQARAYLEESQAIGGGARTLASLGEIFLREGDLDRARRCFEEALAGFAASGHTFNHAAMLEVLGEVARRTGDRQRALDYFSKALKEVQRVGDQAAIAECLDDFAGLAADDGDLVRAARLAGAVSAFRVEGRGEPPMNAAQLDSLPHEAFEAGRMLTLDEAVRYALETDPTRAGDVSATR